MQHKKCIAVELGYLNSFYIELNFNWNLCMLGWTESSSYLICFTHILCENPVSLAKIRKCNLKLPYKFQLSNEFAQILQWMYWSTSVILKKLTAGYNHRTSAWMFPWENVFYVLFKTFIKRCSSGGHGLNHTQLLMKGWKTAYNTLFVAFF